MKIDLIFPVLGQKPLPADHAYALYSALSRRIPALHKENGVAIHTIRGQLIGNRQLALTPQSRLAVRIDAERIAEVLPLAGKQLDIAGTPLRLGVPQVRSLVPAPTLRSRLVVIKTSQAPTAAALTEEIFEQACRRKLAELGIATDASLIGGKRRTLRIKQKEVVGYEVIIEGLTAEESITLQETGLGGRRHMGCGVFVPAKSKVQEP